MELDGVLVLAAPDLEPHPAGRDREDRLARPEQPASGDDHHEHRRQRGVVRARPLEGEDDRGLTAPAKEQRVHAARALEGRAAPEVRDRLHPAALSPAEGLPAADLPDVNQSLRLVGLAGRVPARGMLLPDPLRRLGRRSDAAEGHELVALVVGRGVERFRPLQHPDVVGVRQVEVVRVEVPGRGFDAPVAARPEVRERVRGRVLEDLVRLPEARVEAQRYGRARRPRVATQELTDHTAPYRSEDRMPCDWRSEVATFCITPRGEDNSPQEPRSREQIGEEKKSGCGDFLRFENIGNW